MRQRLLLGVPILSEGTDYVLPRPEATHQGASEHDKALNISASAQLIHRMLYKKGIKSNHCLGLQTLDEIDISPFMSTSDLR